MRQFRWLSWLLVCLPLAPQPVARAESGSGPVGWCGTTNHAHLTSIAAHRQQRSRRGFAALSDAAQADSDDGNVAVLIDAGEMALQENFLDMRDSGLQFAPAGDGYSVTRVDIPFAASDGETLSIGDDDAVLRPLAFSFPYYAENHAEVWINSDGNLTFGAAESSSAARSLGRFLSGPPRVAVLFGDLDPTAGGTVRVDSSADSFRVTWTAVPQWNVGDQNSFSVTLLPSGVIEFSYGSVGGNLSQGVIGVAPGNAADAGLVSVDMSEAAGEESGSDAIAEGFTTDRELDLVAVANRFYESHGDDYQQLIIYSDVKLMTPGVFAFESTINNQIAGLGGQILDFSATYGSAGALESIIFMGLASKYSEDLTAPLNGEDSTLAVTAHEVGHRWLAQARFMDGATSSSALLGRQQAHWSFFMNSRGSYVEGNEIEDQGGGTFATVGASLRYSPLDQYLMGLRAPGEVMPFFYVKDPSGTSTATDRPPETGVTFSGTRRDVTIEEVIAAIGPRNPAPGPQPPFRQAFVLVVSSGNPPNPSDISKIQKVQGAFGEFFNVGTDGRGTTDSTLQ